MLSIESLKPIIAACKSDKQVLTAIKKAGYTVVKDDTQELGSFSIWIDDLTRIYKKRNKEYVLQTWQKVKMEYSGIPTFFATNSYF